MKLFHNTNLQLLSFSNFTHITKKVTEEISDKHLKSFFQTALAQANFPIEKNTKVFYSFMKQSSSYEIYFFQSTQKHPLLEIQLFENYTYGKETTKESYQLFITTNFFTLYCNGQVLLAFENKNYSQSDILKFIQFTHKITINEIILIIDEELNELKKDISNIKPLHLIHLSNSYGHYYYFFYLTLIVLFSFYFYNTTYNDTFSKLPANTLKGKSHKNQEIALKITQFITNLNNKNIKLEELRYDKKIYAKVKSNNQNLYDFLALYKKNMKIVKLEKTNDNLILGEIEIEF